MRESDSFDDDQDHWGLVEPKHEDVPRPKYDCPLWFASRLLLILLVVLFIVWSGALRYG